MQLPAESTPLVTGAEVPTAIRLSEVGQYYGFRVFHVWLILGCILAQMPAAIICDITPFLLEPMQHEFRSTSSMTSFLQTALYLGSLPGALLGGRLCDRYGRKSTLIAFQCALMGLNVLYLAIPIGPAGLMCAAALRFVIGIAYGGMTNGFATYLIELTADDLRGTVAAMLMLGWETGGSLAIGVLQVLGRGDWRVCTAIAPILPGAFGLLAFCLLPESPRWLCVCGRSEEAQHVLDDIFSSPPAMGRAFVGKAPTVTVDGGHEGADSRLSYQEIICELAEPSLIRISFVMIAMYGIITGAGHCVYVWEPRLLALVSGEPDVGLAIFQLVVLSTVVMNIVMLPALDLLGRRCLLRFSALTRGLVFASLPYAGTATTAKALWLMLASLDVVIWTAILAYMSEALPTCLRGSALGLTQAPGRVLAMILPAMVGSLLDWVPIRVIMFGFAGAYVALFFFALLIPEETAQKPTLDVTPMRSSRLYRAELSAGNGHTQAAA